MNIKYCFKKYFFLAPNDVFSPLVMDSLLQNCHIIWVHYLSWFCSESRAIFPPIIGFGTYWTPLNPILYGPYSMGHTINHTDHMIWWGYSKWSSKVFQKQFTVLWGNGSNCLILSALILKMLKILIFNMLCNIRVTKFLHTIQDYYNEEGWIYFFFA